MTVSLYLKVTGDKRLEWSNWLTVWWYMAHCTYHIKYTKWGPCNEKERNTFNAFLFDWSSFDPRFWKSSSAVKSLHWLFWFTKFNQHEHINNAYEWKRNPKLNYLGDHFRLDCNQKEIARTQISSIRNCDGHSNDLPERHRSARPKCNGHASPWRNPLLDRGYLPPR